MSNSALTDVKVLSPNYSTRADTIRKITIHHMAGIMTAAGCGNWFRTGTKGASSNYGIGNDGMIGLYVEEKNRAWTSSSRANDNQAVTIELSNDVNGYPWTISDRVIERCVDLCEDICRRNGIDKMVYTGKTDGNLTRHDMFIATNCPGSYLAGKLPYIVAQVNARLTGDGTAAKAAAVSTHAAITAGVKKFQAWINENDFGTEELEEDGIYGPATRKAAIQALQHAINGIILATRGNTIAEDGLWGPETSAAVADRVCLMYGDRGDLVCILQGMLYGHKITPSGLDGIFKTKTENAVLKYQEAEGLTKDGKAGKNTISRLCSS